MTTFVVDASVVAKWVVVEDGSEKAQLLRQRHRLIAPELALAEVANILSKKIRLGEFSLSEAIEAIGFIKAVRIETVPMHDLLEEAIRLADRLRHPAYDCLYLALALSRDIRFVTADTRFQQKVASLGDRHLLQACLVLADWEDTP